MPSQSLYTYDWLSHRFLAMSTNDGYPRASPDDYRPVINIITWFLLVTTTLAVIARIATKLAISRRTDADDYVTFVALVRILLSLRTRTY